MFFSFLSSFNDSNALCRQSSQAINGLVRLCLANNGVEHRGLCGELLEKYDEVDIG